MIKSLPYYKKICLILKLNNLDNKYIVIYDSYKLKYEERVETEDGVFICYSLYKLRTKFFQEIRRYNLAFYRLLMNKNNEVVFEREETWKVIQHYCFKLFIWSSKNISNYGYVWSLKIAKDKIKYYNTKEEFEKNPDFELEIALVRIALVQLKKQLAAKKMFNIEKNLVNTGELFELLGKKVVQMDLSKINTLHSKSIQNEFKIVPFSLESKIYNSDRLLDILYKGKTSTGRNDYLVSVRDGKVILMINQYDIEDRSLARHLGITDEVKGKIIFKISAESYFFPLLNEKHFLFNIYQSLSKVINAPGISIQSHKLCLGAYFLSRILPVLQEQGLAELVDEQWSVSSPPKLILNETHLTRKNDVEYIYFLPFYQHFNEQILREEDCVVLDDISRRVSTVSERDTEKFLKLIELVLLMLGVRESSFYNVLFFADKLIKEGVYEEA